MKAIKLEFDEQPVIAHPRAICFGKFGSGLWTGKYRLLERLLDEVHFVEELSDLAGLAGEIDMLHCVKVQHLRSLESQSAIIRDSMLRALSLSERLRWGPGRTYLIASLDEAIGVGGERPESLHQSRQQPVESDQDDTVVSIHGFVRCRCMVRILPTDKRSAAMVGYKPTLQAPYHRACASIGDSSSHTSIMRM